MLVLVVLSALAVASPAGADTVSDSYPLPIWRVGGYLGAANNSPDGGSWGVIPDRDHYLLALNGATTVFRLRRFSLAYAPELVPLVVITKNPKYANETQRVNGRPTVVRVERGRGPVVGAGFSPLGLEASFRVRPQWRVHVASAVGALWFTREVPIVNSRDFNYTWELGGGVLWEYRRGRWIRAGYEFHHLSNLDSRPENPGLDGNVFYLGWQFMLRSP